MKTYSLDDFGHITSAKNLVSTAILSGEIPSIDDVKMLATWTEEMRDVFDRDKAWFDNQPEDEARTDRSASLSRLAYLGAENGWSDEQILSALLDADNRWEKYSGRKTQEKLLLDLINRARQKYGYNPVTDIDFASLLAGKGSASSDDEEPPKLVYDFGEFLDADFKIEWMLDGLLSVGGFGLITGYPGVGKTQLALQMAFSLAAQREQFLKWRNVGSAKKVLFLSLEMGPSPLHLFMSTIAPEYDDVREQLARNVNIVPLGTNVGFDTKEGQALMTKLLDEYMPDLLVVDSLQAAVSKELTDETAVKTFMAYVKQLRKRYNMAVLMVHHNRKKAAEQQAAGIEISDVYGSQFLAAEVEFVLTLNSVSPTIVNLTHAKNRLGVQLDPFEISRNEHLTFTLDFEHIRDHYPTGGSGGFTFGSGLEI